MCRENYLGLRNLTKWKMSRTNKTDMRDFDEQTGGNDHHAHFKNAPDHDGDDDV